MPDPAAAKEPASAPSKQASPIQLGQRLGNYRILRPLGQGGMGSVYEAEHQYIDRKGAVKVLHPDLSQNPQFASRFLNEARAVNLIKHPGLVEIFEFGLLEDGTAYIIMELLRGVSLSEHLRRSPGGLGSAALAICRQIAQAMAAAHQKGIVHRDLKPDNVMLVPDPERPGEQRVKVLDFGIAKLSQHASGADGKVRTETGTMIGTPAYMAPEQCLADPQLDGKADVYALGVMLYEMLSDRLPFRAEHSFDYMVAHVRGTPRPLGEVAPQVPPEVVDLVHAMLAKTPAERPTMETIVALLEQLQAALPALWVLPGLAGASAATNRSALASEDTQLGPSSASARRSPESLALGATVAGRATPSGLLSQRRLPAASQASVPERSTGSDRAASSTNSGRSASAVSAVSSGSSARAAAESISLTPLPAATASSALSALSLRAAASPRQRWLLVAFVVAAAAAVGGLTRLRAAAPVVTAPVVVPAPRLVRWVVLSVPPGAEVVRADGQLLGTTPWELDRQPGTGETVLTLRRPGFKDKAILLSHSTDVKTEVYLEAATATPAASAAAVEPPAPPATPPKRRKLPAHSSGARPSGGDVQLLLD